MTRMPCREGKPSPLKMSEKRGKAAGTAPHRDVICRRGSRKQKPEGGNYRNQRGGCCGVRKGTIRLDDGGIAESSVRGKRGEGVSKGGRRRQPKHNFRKKKGERLKLAL